MAVSIACVVEGHGDRDSVPILIRRIAQRIDPGLVPEVSRPIRIPKSKLLRPGELERAVQLGALQIRTPGGILVLLDSDDDCPAELGPELLRRAQASRPDLAISVVIAKAEFESWFLAAASSLAGRRNLDPALVPPPDPELTGDAKGWLERNMVGGHKYVATLDQAAMTAMFDIDEALTAASFEKCHRELTRLLTVVGGE